MRPYRQLNRMAPSVRRGAAVRPDSEVVARGLLWTPGMAEDRHRRLQKTHEMAGGRPDVLRHFAGHDEPRPRRQCPEID